MDDRRERYAAAMYEAANPGFRWVDAPSVDQPYWRELADVSMAEADMEWSLICGWLAQENARLRAELEAETEETARLSADTLVQERVADEEIQRLREESATAERLLREAHEETAQLRTRLSQIETVVFGGGYDSDVVLAVTSILRGDPDG